LLYNLSLETQYENEDVYVSEASERMRKAFQVVRKQLNANFERAKRRYDERVKSTKFREGEFVWHFIPCTEKGMNKKWMMTNKGPYRIIKRLNDVNFVVQKLPTSGMEIVHIDRLTRFHGTVPKLWKQAMRKEQDIAHEMSASKDEAQKNAINVEATRAKSSLELSEQVVASTNNSDAHNMADKNASNCNATSTDSGLGIDVVDDLVDISVDDLATS